MSDPKKTSFQREFEQSATYRVINSVIDTDAIGAKVERAVQEVNNAVNHINRDINDRVRESVSASNRPPQNNYRTPPQYKAPTPPPQKPPVQRPTPPPRPRMEVRRKPSNAKYWITGAVCAIYSLTMPMYDWYNLISLVLVGVGAFTLSKLIFKGKKYYVPIEEPKPEPVKPPEPVRTAKASTGDPEVDKIIDEGNDYIKQLRHANDLIEDEVMSDRIDRMEAASADIFAYIAEHPEKAPQIRRFMNYYLPTTLKLLTSYDKLSRQRVKGENIQKTMFEIEGMMETIAGAFEKQLDSLFHEDAMDIAADISVMESILQQEGLSGSEMPKTRNAGSDE